jgi:beta-lactam-binding protein with PASTA domain
MTPEERKRRRWKRGIAGLVIVLVVFPLLAVTGIAIFRSRHEKADPPQTIVPNFRGLDLKTAESQARQAQLNPKVLLRRWDKPAPLGTIVGQVPDAGASVPVGTLVGLELCVEDPDKAFWEDKKKKGR